MVVVVVWLAGCVVRWMGGEMDGLMGSGFGAMLWVDGRFCGMMGMIFMVLERREEW